jgi:hypothetical protein
MSDTASETEEFAYEMQSYAGFASAVSSESSMNAAKKRNRNMLDNYKKSDLGYRQISNGKGKKKLDYYATSYIPGARIRNAITGGVYENYRVGHIHEDLFFKVSYAGESSSQSISVMYYDDPDQFERHMSVNLSDSTKTAWLGKYERACSILSVA